MELEQINDDAPLLSESRPRGKSNVSEDGGRSRAASTASVTSEGGTKRRASRDRGPINAPYTRVTPQLTSVSDMETYKRSDEELGQMKNKAVRAFYRKQNDVINMLISGTEVEVDNSEGLSPQTRFIITFSFICNVLLFIVKLIAAVSSGSLSVVASTIDSLLDLISGSFLFFVSRFINKEDPYNYPESKTRMEPLGIVAFAAIMGMASLQLTKEAIFTLFYGIFKGDLPEVNMNIFTIVVIVSTIVVKAGLYTYCRMMDNPPSIVDALRDDHRNDCITNALAAVGAIVAGEFKMLWWFDAATALAFSIWILFSWVEQGREQVGLLVGKAAPADLIGRLAYLAGRHDDRIDRVDTVRAFRFGEKYLAEVDIILPETMMLKEAHDIGEQLQIKIENEAEIQRAYVHLDYEWDHAPEH